MFGHQDDQPEEHNDTNNVMTDGNSGPAVDQHSGTNNSTTYNNIIQPDNSPHSDNHDQGHKEPWEVTTSEDVPSNKDVFSPAGGYPQAPSQKVHSLPSASDNNSAQDATNTLLELANGDLAAIKIQALDELYPLIDKLDLSPEERFKTLMMMIQASDNQELVKSAYEAAHEIKDEKVKAQSLLDIVNEINYFTQHPISSI